MLEFSNAYLFHALPPLFLLVFFFLRDRFKEPFRYVLASFMLGVAISYPLDYLIIIVDYFSSKFLLSEIIVYNLFDSFFRAAYLEEGLKFIIIYFFCTKLPEFNEKYDALIYSASVGLGYAGMENIGYLYIEGAKFSERIYPLFLHLGLALIMGIFLMKSIFNKFNKKLCIFLSLLLPILIHGFHNFIISTGTNLTLLLWIILIALNFLFIIFMIFYSRSIQTKKIIEDEIKYEISDAEAIKSYFYVFFIISVIILFGYLF